MIVGTLLFMYRFKSNRKDQSSWNHGTCKNKVIYIKTLNVSDFSTLKLVADWKPSITDTFFSFNYTNFFSKLYDFISIPNSVSVIRDFSRNRNLNFFEADASHDSVIANFDY